MARQGFSSASLAYGHVGAPPRLVSIGADEKSRFHYWSLSKPITSAVVLATLQLDDSVEGTTVRQLLMHMGGWDRAIAGDPVTGADPAGDCTTMNAPPRQFAPGRRFVYSNVGYCLLGRAIRSRTGATYQAAARRVLPETGSMDYDPSLGPAGGWSGTAEQYFFFASRPLPDLSERIGREGGLPYSLGWATDGRWQPISERCMIPTHSSCAAVISWAWPFSKGAL